MNMPDANCSEVGEPVVRAGWIGSGGEEEACRKETVGLDGVEE